MAEEARQKKGGCRWKGQKGLSGSEQSNIIQKKYGVFSKDMPIIVLDHVIPAANEKTAINHKKIRNFVNNFNIKNFFDIGIGICHQIVVEKGFSLPGKLILGSDSHTCSYGAVGTFSTGIDRTEAASLLLTGQTWLKIPNSIKITLKIDCKEKSIQKIWF